LVDDVIDEPLIGAHRDKEAAAVALKNYYLDSVKELTALSKEELLNRRYEKLMALGSFNE
jgi:acetyl-CoA carboxylase carboxyl transferase subunit alpha